MAKTARPRRVVRLQRASNPRFFFLSVPKDLVGSLALAPGDSFRVREEDGRLIYVREGGS